MKRLIGSVLVLVIICAWMASCEKDDICADGTPTTPNMIVEFYNAGNREAPREVTNLEYFVEGREDTIAVGTVDSTAVPLRVDTTSTKWGFTYNRVVGSGQVEQLTDYIEFKYSTMQEYVSRACGYKTLFTLDQTVPNPVLTPGSDGALWIQSVEIEQPEILNEDEVHVKIYF